MKTVRLTMAQALVKFFDNQYFNIDGSEKKFVAGYMGIFGHGNAVGLGQALEQYKDEIIFYQGKNEQGIAHAAIAYAKQNNRSQIFACTASIGPGSLNMVTAAGTATVNRIPCLFLPSDTYAARQPDPVLQQIENTMDYTVTANDSFKAVSKYWDRIIRPEQLMVSAINAMRVLTDPAETGAVTLCLPQDVQGEAYDYPAGFFAKRTWYLDRRPAAPEAIGRMVELIKGKKRPLAICGGGVKYSLAGKEFVAFAERFNIPFAETQAGKGTIPWDHPLNLGCVGACGTLCANLIAKEADLVIAVGTKLNDFVTASKSAFPAAEMASININGADAAKMDSRMVVADAGAALAQLSAGLAEEGYRTAYAGEVAAAREKWEAEYQKLTPVEIDGGLSQAGVLIAINNFIDKDSIAVCASGSLPSDMRML